MMTYTEKRRLPIVYSVGLLVLSACTALPGCRQDEGVASTAVVGNDKYTILDTRTDGFDFNKAKSLAQDAITAYPQMSCMVGLFAYNPPLILEAVRDAKLTGKKKIVAFDEDAVTLQGIIDGEIYGTVVQNPYMYGYESVRVLAGLIRGDNSVMPEGGFKDIAARQIRQDHAQAFRDELQQLLAASPVKPSANAQRPTVAFVTNGIASFWDVAEKGALAAGRDFDVNVEIRMPPNGVDDQNRMVQTLLANKVDGIAISPIDPDNQTELLEEACRRTRLITHDSDAPNSQRLCYIGMDNYKAGRMCGQLIKEALPEGGSIMLFVGRLGQANAQLRRQGIIDELLDKSP
ncbi:MAG: substrate-binding domain-containing protein [Pirellulaceae bacterium]|nr:substrate-binding domain-containing protein [Pirellulaceae bacterium]